MFVHLHLHTEYSLLDGFCRIPQLIRRAKELGFDALAITDHGVLYGVIDFYLACKEAGIKPIIGCEVYISESHHDKSPSHLILLAKNNTGYKNLIKLVTWSHLNGFYYKPQISREELSKSSDGLIALSACPQGRLGRLILSGDLEQAAREALWYKEVFGEFYLEVQRHPIPELEAINRGLYQLSRELGLPLVATGDVHYIDQADAPIHDLLLCIQTGSSIYEKKRLRMPGDFFYLHSPDEIASLFSDIPEAIRSTEEIASKCDIEIELDKIYLPKPELPEGVEAQEYLERLSWEGLYSRFPNPSPQLCSRLSYELDVIRRTKFAPYFLIVYDLFRFAKERGILFGIRGSGASSLVLHVLGLTQINPLEHGLLFDRFLNVERRELPDIDLDFEDRYRHKVIEHVCKKYGSDRVAQIITFGTLGAKAAIRDVGRALALPPAKVDRVARLVPEEQGISLSEAIKESRGLSRMIEEDEDVRRLIDLALRVEGVARHASTHAAGIVISPEPLVNLVPLQRPIKGWGELPMTQFDMNSISRIGLLKLDILGLSNLTVLSRTKELLSSTRGIEIELDRLPLDDERTFSFLSEGETGCVFQLESPGMRRAIKKLKPSSFNELAALIALYRPGPKEHIPEFVSAKQGKPPHYPHPAIKDILAETYGIIVYQEQVLLIAQALSGYSLGEADALRKAIGKKIPQIMQQERERFISKAVERGISEDIAVKVFNMIEPFAGYAFNKAHSVSYALLAYQTAYLKANYPIEYMTSFLNTFIEKTDKLASGIEECHRLGIAVLPPDINLSEDFFSIQGGAIRFGLAAIKNVGEGAVELILKARGDGGHFKSVRDFCSRVDLKRLGRRALESLIKAGALDPLCDRGTLLYNIDKLVSFSESDKRVRREWQASLFDLSEVYAADLGLERRVASFSEICSWEREVLGIPLSEMVGEKEKASQEERRKLFLKIRREGDKSCRVEFFKEILNLLRQYPGEDEVYLVLDTGERCVIMEWPGLRVNYVPELHRRLSELIGEESIKLNP